MDLHFAHRCLAVASMPMLVVVALSGCRTSQPKSYPCVETDRPYTSTTAVRATGIGHPPPNSAGSEARLMAQRAAEVDALRNLAKQLGYDDPATIRDFRFVSVDSLADDSVQVVVENAPD